VRPIFHIHHIKMSYKQENRALLRKIRDIRDKIISLKERRPPPTERDTKDHQQNKRSDHTGRREHNGQRLLLVEDKFVPIHSIVSLNLYQSYITGTKGSTTVTLVNMRTQTQWER
jgi:hypothetical protein